MAARERERAAGTAAGTAAGPVLGGGSSASVPADAGSTSFLADAAVPVLAEAISDAAGTSVHAAGACSFAAAL